MLDLQHLKTFMAVVTTMSFSRAAEELHYSQSSVTHHIKTLERNLGVRLLNRFRFAKSIALTDAGGKIYEYSARLLALAEEAEAAVRPKKNKRSAGNKETPSARKFKPQSPSAAGPR
jgi:DNA-binding transcriptional LysR family regulator